MNDTPKNDKWVMFKQYMHNELGISKEDIRSWVQEAVHIEATRIAEEKFQPHQVRTILIAIIEESKWYAKDTFTKDIRQQVAEQLIKKIDLKINPKPND